MTADETARALVAHERFECRNGMLVWPRSRASVCGPYRLVDVRPSELPGLLPDIEDPATAGVLVAMLAEAWPNIQVSYYHGMWGVALFFGQEGVHGVFEAKDLGVPAAKALLCAWGTNA